MEGISQSVSAAASAVQAAGESITETTGKSSQSIPTPTPNGTISKPITEFSSFMPFDPTSFEKMPKEFGNTDPFKDTSVVARAQLPLSHPERFDFVDFNFLYSEKYETITQSPKAGSVKMEPNAQNEGASNNSTYEFEIGKTLATPEPPTYNIQISSKRTTEDFESLTFEDIEIQPSTEKGVTEAGLTHNLTEPNLNSEQVEAKEAVQTQNTSTNQQEDYYEEPEEFEEIFEKDPEESIRKDITENETTEGQPDEINNMRPKYVVDVEAMKARIQDAEISIKSISSTDEEISGEKIADLMNQIPSFEETSEVLTIIPTYKDGSYSEVLEDISKLTFSDKSSALIKIIEIIRNKPAVMMSQIGKAVNEFDVERVFKYVKIHKGTALNAIHT